MGRLGRPGQVQAVWSSVAAPGPLAWQEAMPSSRAFSPEYIWLWPMTWPLPAFSTK